MVVRRRGALGKSMPTSTVNSSGQPRTALAKKGSEPSWGDRADGRRFDSLEYNRLGIRLPRGGFRFAKVDDLGFSLDFWSSPSLVLERGYHRVDGAAIAHGPSLFNDSIEGILEDDSLLSEAIEMRGLYMGVAVEA